MFIIVGGIIAVIIFGVIIKMFVAKEPRPSPTEQKSDNPSGKLTEKELEKYLLEKRLELQKYFGFNLGELQTGKNSLAENTNWRITNNRLDNDLTKLTVECQKHLEKQGYRKKGSGLAGKNSVYFFGDNNGTILSFDNDFVRDLDQKILSGNWYIFFEKAKSYDWPLGWFDVRTDGSGQKWLHQTPHFQLRLKNASTIICESKEKALEIIKTDPALQGKF